MELIEILFIIMASLMLLLICVEIILLKGILSLRQGLDRTRDTMDNFQENLSSNLKLAVDSTDGIKYIADVIKNGKIKIKSKMLGDIEVEIVK